MDFHDEFPQFCAIRTSLQTWQIEATWVRNVLCLVLGTYLGYTDINQARSLLSKMESQGFRFITVGNTPVADIYSGSGDDETKLVSNQAANHPRCVPIVMPDPLGKTGPIRFCFFFKTK